MSQDKPSIREVTTELEHGNAAHVGELFSGKSEDERLQALQTMQQLYKGDLNSGATKSDLSFNAHAWYHPIIEIYQGDTPLYSDTLDLDTMKHSNGNDAVPADRKPIDQQQLRQVTTDLENGQGASLKAALDGKFIEERAHYLQAVVALNQKDVSAHKTAVVLQSQLQGPKFFGDELSLYRNAPGGFFSGNYWTNPNTIYNEKLNLQTGQRAVNVYSDSRK
ncbi:MAG TPA: hypothetical protein V6C81_31810 [Planktothrix sp.]|jgi:hypothetical protein